MASPISASVTDDEAAYDAMRADHAAWRPIVVAIAKKHGLAATVEQIAEGSNLIAFAGDCVVKVFPRFLRHQYETERVVLPHVAGKLSVATPALVAEGAYEDGWDYLVVTRIVGRSLDEVWEQWDHADKCRAMEKIGALIGELQAIPLTPALRAIEPQWDPFIARMRARAVERHRELGLPQALLEDLPRYLAAADMPRCDRPVLLTGEFTPMNVIARDREVVGLIDFADCMTGLPDYDLLGPFAFSICGDAALLGAFLRGRGIDHRDISTLRSRWMALLVLHRFANLRRQLRLPGWERAGSLAELATWLFPE